ncbi:hypothetical protein DVQ33_06115 [Yersinia enterocolitica]|nr:hypothetical protein [Yersinia enterocolitica]EKN5089332.1 hypothetical protein [Yersinia enterocolitica]EKN5097242.1 hypothetical protein [Yersinia enterocolitica]EKN5100377.1 hypothetical protein [Yersinia enterocolitica]EKN5109778.1 hypothetical protein [Yersinia enterocolitica]
MRKHYVVITKRKTWRCITKGNTRHLSSRRCVGYAQSPESLTYVSSSGFFRLPPSCVLKSIGYT